jgi:uncharacterized protein (TIRG00374 family)
VTSLSKAFSVKRSVLVMVAGLVAFIIYLYFFIGIPKILRVLSGINSVQYAFFYSLSLLAVLASVFFWSAAWNSILRSLSVKISYHRAYLFYWVGYFSDLVLPCATVCGELTRLYLVKKETDKGYGTLASSAVSNRVVAYTIVTVGLYGGAFLIFLKPGVSSVVVNLFIVFLVGVSAYFSVLLYLAFFKQAAGNFSVIYVKVMKALRPKHFSPFIEMKAKASLSSYYDGFRLFREKPRLLVRPLVFHLTSYLLGLFAYVSIFYALGIPSTIEFYIVVYFIATAVQDIAASFSVGSLEAILTSIFVIYGLPVTNAVVTALFLRSAGFWFPLLVGFLAVQILGARTLISKVPELSEIEGKASS